MKIDVIIPVYKPGRELFELLDRLSNQTVPVHRIILMNTEERFFEEAVDGTDFSARYRNVQVHHLSKREFDHGRTRHRGVQSSEADIFVLMTQDAMPADEFLLEKLTRNLSGQVAVAYARQLPREDSSALEKVSRQFNYPETSRVKGLKDLGELGIKTYFCSNVCAAYRRDIYEELGGFLRRTIFNEDMIYAAKAVKAGYLISYEAQAQVIHSHNYTCGQQFHRNFDLGVSQADHPEIFSGVKSESEGKKLLKAAGVYFKENGQRGKLFAFYIQCCFKYAGYLLGKNYKKLPKKMVLWASDNKEYWSKNHD